MKATAKTIAAVQHPSGAIPWEAGRHIDPWNHTEAAMGMAVAGLLDEGRAAYEWLARTQNDDGSWFASYQDSDPADTLRDTNYTAYVAVGVRHHWLLTGDHDFVTTMWPTVRAAIDFVLGLQRADGTVPWFPGSGITLRAGCSSIHHAVRAAMDLARVVDDPRPSWAEPADRLADAIRRPERFLSKPHSMDWYYPVLSGVLDTDSLARRWHEFVVPGLGVRCVDDQPWVTGGETAELAITLAVRGHLDQARRLMNDVERLRHHDGSYWTGYQYRNDVLWPDERTTWTAAAVLLAHAAIAGDPATTTTFTPTSTNPEATARSSDDEP